jgi:hypothetical protein
MRSKRLPVSHQPCLLGAAVLWLLGGGILLLTTLAPMHTELLGWTPTFWLLGAPLVVLLGLEPGLPRQLLALRQPHRRAMQEVVWHGCHLPR